MNTRYMRVHLLSLAIATIVALAIILTGCGPSSQSPRIRAKTKSTPTASPAPTPTSQPPTTQPSAVVSVTSQPPKPPTRTTTTTRARAVSSPKPRVVTLYPVTAYFSQATVDRGKLVTWMTEPTCLLAGHDNMGWNWLDNIAVGTVIQVRAGPCYGDYVVYAHKWQSVKGGEIPGWMYDPGLHLALQTCTGSTGTGFSLARRR